MSDQQIACSGCGDTFVFTDAEQTFYREKGLAAPPKRCKPCRDARKAASGGGSGGGRSNGPPRSHGPPRYNGPPRANGPPRYNAAPRQNGGSDQRGRAGRGTEHGPPIGNAMDMRAGSWAPRGGGQPHGTGGGTDRGRGGGHDPRAGGQGFQARDGRDSRAGSAPRGRGPRTPSTGASSEYRSPAFPDQRPPRREDASSRNPRQADAKGPRDGNVAPTTPRPERPKFDITCVACGVAAQVPFKPIEGREVFCQECYRARRGTTRPETDGHDVATDAEGGIVE